MNVTRVVVVGTSCSGKTTRRLARILATNSWVKSGRQLTLPRQTRVSHPERHARTYIIDVRDFIAR